MAPTTHAKLSPSSAAMWSNCAASIRAQQLFREQHPERVRGDTVHSIRGTQAHDVAEKLLLGFEPDRPDDESLTDDEWDDMVLHGAGYAAYVKGLWEEGGLLLVEKRVKMNEVANGMYGTADTILFGRDNYHLQIVDYKYGMGEVLAEENPQLMLYAVGASNIIKEMGQRPRQYTCHVYQPRTGGTPWDSYSFSHDRLVEFAEFMQNAAKETENPDAEFTPGEKQCQWCDAKPTCRAFAQYSIEKSMHLMDLLDDLTDTRVGVAHDDLKERKPELMETDELLKLFEMFPAARKWMDSVEQFLTQETAAGKIPSMKMVEGRGSNYCIDQDAVGFMVGDEAWKEPQLKSVTELKKVVGPKNYDELIGDYFRKKPGKPKMVSVEDKRPALKTDADLLKLLD